MVADRDGDSDEDGDGCMRLERRRRIRLERQLWRSVDQIRLDRRRQCGDDGSRRQTETETATATETAASDSRGGDGCVRLERQPWRWIGSARDSSSVVVMAVGGRPRRMALETEMAASDLRGGDGCVRLERQWWRSMDRINSRRQQCGGDGSRRQTETDVD